MGYFLERRLKQINPYASIPSTRDQQKQARKQAKADRKSAARRTGHHTELRSGRHKPRWPW